ncbi:MAG: S8 family serine peptidase, partial [Thermoplasmata archaeon]|nr:S8 family serine peptidase [Thermoplasmata archaeon]
MKGPMAVLIVLAMILPSGLSLVQATEPGTGAETPAGDVNNPLPEGFVEQTWTDDMIHIGKFSFDPLVNLPDILPEYSLESPSGYYIVQLEDMSGYEDLESTGASILQYVPTNSYMVEMRSGVADEVRGLDCVRWVGIYQPAYKILGDIPYAAPVDIRLDMFQYDESALLPSDAVDLRRDAQVGIPDKFPTVQTLGERNDISARFEDGTELEDRAFASIVGKLDAEFPEQSGLPSFDEQLKKMWTSRLDTLLGVTGGELVSYRGEDVAHVRVHYSAIPLLARIPQVQYVSQWDEIEFSMDIIRTSDPMTGQDNAQTMGYDGSTWRTYYPGALPGVVVDNGIDPAHPDLTHVTRYNSPVNDVGNNHGTSTTGIVFGDGTGDSTLRGALSSGYGAMAQHTMDEAVAKDTNQLDDGYFSSHSYFTGNNDGWYDSRANELDNDLWTDQAFVYVFGAGNVPNADGEHVTGEGCAKNVITVGGLWPGNGGTASYADDQWTHASWGAGGNHGPTDYGALKPDVAMFYDDIATTYNTGDAASGYTSAFGGTSGATPIVAGCVGQFTEAWIDDYFGNNVGNNKPVSGATVKAAIINTADHSFPNDVSRYNAGWGYPHNDWFFDGRGWIFHDYADYRDSARLTNDGGAPDEIVPSTTTWPLRVTLSWYDQAGGAAGGDDDTVNRLVNDLNLRVVDTNNGDVFYGNMGMMTSQETASGTGTNPWSGGGKNP